MLRVMVTSILVDNQGKAEKFYTEKLGFQKKHDIPVHGARWLTVVSPADPDGTEIVLEPMGFDFAKTYQKALYDHGVPLTALGCDNVEAEYERLKARGVKFKSPPSKQGKFPANAVFDDTCGNYVMISEPNEPAET
jgi:hypothetical protein